MRFSTRWPALLAGMLLTLPLAAQDFFIYPNNGQSAAQQEQDEFACFQWARDQSGFDPMARPQASTPPPQTKEPTASAGRGIIGGAASGAIIGGATGGDVGESAAIGAVVGGLFGNARRNRQQEANRQQQDQWASQEASRYQQQRNTYNRAFVACMQGRGYTVQ
jgi:hypothetical protein